MFPFHSPQKNVKTWEHVGFKPYCTCTLSRAFLSHICLLKNRVYGLLSTIKDTVIGHAKSSKRLTSITCAHSFAKNWQLSLNQRKARMTLENISWSISTKECCRNRQGSNPRPPDHQSDSHPTEPPSRAPFPCTINFKCQENLYLKMSSVYVVCSIFLQILFCIQANMWTLIRLLHTVCKNDF